VRSLLLLLGIAVAVLWLAGLRLGADAWLSWLDFAAALVSIAVAAIPERRSDRSPSLSPNARRGERTGEMGSHVDMLLGDDEHGESVLMAPFLVAGVLLVLWVLALALHAERWLAWWNFALGVAYGLAGLAGGALGGRRRSRRVTTS